MGGAALEVVFLNSEYKTTNFCYVNSLNQNPMYMPRPRGKKQNNLIILQKWWMIKVK